MQHSYHWGQGTFMALKRALAQMLAKVQMDPVGGEVWGPAVNIFIIGWLTNWFSNARFFKTKKGSFPLVPDLTLT